MSTSNGFSKTLMFGAIALACGALYSAPASAVTRSFYQNAGATCHGVDAISDSKLTRTANRLINKTNSSVDVVCNLPAEAYAILGSNNGAVSYVALWARRYLGTGKTISCTLNEGFYGETGAQVFAPDAGNPISLPNSGAQAIAQWTPTGTTKFLAPVNIYCTLQPYTELNDWFVKYDI
ncbi:MAG: hypothetical protein J0H95_05965 [Xanthomonadales bacterium]|nr:hypothetical protein [Xanthomonadales bacterium]MBN8794983.1 hypothetical protein [Stenotrophomonas nitritireducens]